ncbi:MAG: hypothetical protein GVY19_12570 [Bacteroidetes bacterium]|nr:hypothetical protein [Bacteroidota bacterium]
MKYLVRELSEKIINKIQPNKVVMVFGARRVGKTVLVKQILEQINEPALQLLHSTTLSPRRWGLGISGRKTSIGVLHFLPH